MEKIIKVIRKTIDCKKHGKTMCRIEVFENGWRKNRCIKCSTEYRRNGRRRHKLKLIKLLGGKCMRCGYDKCPAALEFHHLDPSKKSFTIGDEKTHKSQKYIEKEIKKCILICANCHAEEHWGK